MEKKDIIINKLREHGCRITNQRLVILDVVLDGKCTSCKEIYYQAVKKDASIGTATVYRMINTLEEIGAINRKGIYKIDDISSRDADNTEHTYTVEFDDDTSIKLSAKKWNQIIQNGLKVYGYEKNIRKISVKPS